MNIGLTTLVPFVCPRDRATLTSEGTSLRCQECGVLYPTVGSIPILIDDESSVFSRTDYLTESTAYAGPSYGDFSDKTRGIRKLVRRFALFLSHQNVDIASLSPEDAITRIRAERPNARILVIGAGNSNYHGTGLIYTDVAFGRNVICICDAHSLPFPDGYFDGVIAVAVLEHVADPNRCVAEILRVLTPNGFTYCSTPFLVPVHMGAHDFTRFTYLGHRRLFRWFDDIESGPALGPGASAAYLFQALLLCISDAKVYRRIARLVGLILGALIRQTDRFFPQRKGAYDVAAAVFFFGRKRSRPFSDKEIITMYRGAP